MNRNVVAGALGLGLIVYPLVVPVFWILNIGAQALILGIIALSLTFLVGYGGIASMAQITLAGVAGYTVALLSTTAGGPLPWPLIVIAALLAGGLGGLLVGLISVRTQGIYLLMITLAISVSFYYFAQQNYEIFRGHSGFNRVTVPAVAGISLREPVVFYYICLAAAFGLYRATCYIAGTPFGLALQGIRDNPRRMAALGYHVKAHQVAAFALAGFMAASGGVLSVWYHGRIAPTTVNLVATINIMIIAVVGGLAHPAGAFLGAVLFVFVQNFAIDLIDRERFNTLIGLTFLVVVLFSPDGLLGIGRQLRKRWDSARHDPVGVLRGSSMRRGESWIRKAGRAKRTVS
jgi:branched-chain amino acid transport system permease protein